MLVPSLKPLLSCLILFPSGAVATEVTSIDSKKSLSSKIEVANTPLPDQNLPPEANASLSLDYHQDAAAGTHFIEGLLPLMQRQQQLTFMQGGWYRQRQQEVLSVGLGHRWAANTHWGWGYNLFYDKAIYHSHHRMSVGAEMWLRSLSVLANGYLPLNHWQTVRPLMTYRSRPARGFDLTLKGYLPACPYLEGSLRYTRFLGNALVGDQDQQQRQLQPHPKSWALGVSYTPIPLLTLEYRYQTGQGGRHRLGALLTYRFNTPLALQRDPTQVALLRAPNRHLVDHRVSRESTMVLEHTKVVVPAVLAQPATPPQKLQPPKNSESEAETQSPQNSESAMQSPQVQALESQVAALQQQIKTLTAQLVNQQAIKQSEAETQSPQNSESAMQSPQVQALESQVAVLQQQIKTLTAQLVNQQAIKQDEQRLKAQLENSQRQFHAIQQQPPKVTCQQAPAPGQPGPSPTPGLPPPPPPLPPSINLSPNKLRKLAETRISTQAEEIRQKLKTHQAEAEALEKQLELLNKTKLGKQVYLDRIVDLVSQATAPEKKQQLKDLNTELKQKLELRNQLKKDGAPTPNNNPTQPKNNSGKSLITISPTKRVVGNNTTAELADPATFFARRNANDNISPKNFSSLKCNGDTLSKTPSRERRAFQRKNVNGVADINGNRERQNGYGSNPH